MSRSFQGRKVFDSFLSGVGGGSDILFKCSFGAFSMMSRLVHIGEISSATREQKDLKSGP